MLVRLSRTLILVALVALIAAPGASGQEVKKNVKDRAEYDLYVAISKEADNNKKLQLLNEWKQKYPATDFKEERLEFYLFTYQGLNRAADMYETAKELVALNPKNIRGLSWVLVLTPTLGKNTPDILDTGEKAANSLLSSIDTLFAASAKPAATSEADWTKARTDSESLAHKTLGWVAMQRKDYAAAEKQFKESLKDNPNAGEVSYWLGTVLVSQRVAEKQAEALFHFARASTYEGPGALSAQGRAEINKYFEKVYNSYHGSAEGIDALRQAAKTSATPPEGFKIKSSYEVALEKEEELKRTNPMLALWLNVRSELTGANGPQYWEGQVKGAGLPGGVSGVSKFKGKLVSHAPAKNPKELVLAISDASTPEVTLKLDEAMAGAADPGTEIEFEGVAAEFSKDPFMLTFDVEKAKVSGWPAPVKKAPAAKKAVRKKK
ncbi:MAG TPA: hypothetical protein VLE22_07910 [Bryobacteraceae bacterium]|nr:hypothetical protein [Bryobacteraceae bacterium]